MLDFILVCASVLFLFFAIEIYYYSQKGVSLGRESWHRFNAQFIFLFTLISIFSIYTIFLNLALYVWLFYLTIILFGYVFLTEFYVYNREFRFRLHWNQNPRKLSLGILTGVILIYLIIFSLVNANPALIVDGQIFTAADWFSETFMSLLTSENVTATLSLMTIGAITIIIAKARRSPTFAISGFFLIIALPIFNVFDTLFTKVDEIQSIAPTLYIAFQNAGLCIVIYTVIQLMFYVLLTSTIIVMLSMMDAVRI